MQRYFLNLIFSNCQDSPNLIPYSKVTFPDGQQDLVLDMSYDLFKTRENADSIEIIIISSITEFNELELILCANNALREIGFTKISLFATYLLGARSDRKFANGTCNYLKHVVATVINSQKFKQVYVYDPHSDVTEGVIDNFIKVHNLDFIECVISDIKSKNYKNIVLVSPDSGALKKTYCIAEFCKIPDMIIATKHRSIGDNAISNTTLSSTSQFVSDSTLVIIDDICDGGRTFKHLANLIHNTKFKNDEPFTGHIILVVSHGIFSNGLTALAEFDEIYYTDSFVNLTVLNNRAKLDKYQPQVEPFYSIYKNINKIL